MNEQPVTFASGDLTLEGLWAAQDGELAAVITHPHPQYGGEMRNNVVEALVEAFYAKGFSTLRFNFRGTGASGGSFDNGPGEANDLVAALDFCRSRGKAALQVGGYSFGAWVTALAADRLEGIPLAMVAPPAGFLEFPTDRPLPGLYLIVAGGHDQFGPLTLVENLKERAAPQAKLTVIESADHFFWTAAGELDQALADGIKVF